MPDGGTENQQRRAAKLGAAVARLMKLNAEEYGLLSPRQIEAQSGVAQGTVHNLWNGLTWPRWDTVDAVAEVFDLNLALRSRWP